MTTSIGGPRSQMDIDGDGLIENWERYLQRHQLIDPTRTESGSRPQNRGNLENLTNRPSGEFARFADAESPAGNEAGDLAALVDRMENVLAELEQARLAGEAERVATLEQQLQQMINRAEIRNPDGSTDLSRFERQLGESGRETSRTEARMTSASSQSTGRGQPQTGPYKAASLGRNGGDGFSPPAGWGAQTMNMPQFNSDAFLQAQAFTDEVMNSWDQINQNTNRGRQLMMLFFYFARMAQSGDMGAMYQFMKFITYIISKDKAKQQIEMGKKMIQLQELSRHWTNMMYKLKTDANDPSATNELMKTMTIVKSETDAIATSQKLLSQVMEEFAQVVETMTNLVKGASEAYGRIMRTVSIMK